MNNQQARMYLARHGATDANMQTPYVLQGSHADNPLNETGKAQAASLAQMLSTKPISAIYSSKLSRAFQTAEIIAARHGLTPRKLAGLEEIDVGQWEGRGWAEIEEHDPAAFAAYNAAPGSTPYHGGESYADVLSRSRPVLEELLQRHLGEVIVVVAHNVVNRAYTAHLLGLDLNLAKNIRQTNCGVNAIDYSADKGGIELTTLNADDHILEHSGATAL